MPHVSEAVAASHDRHDLLLVAALAAGDLTGAERDQALALTSSCSECAALRDDLVAIARAAATLPPPVTSAGRDFRLSPEQAASLRRTGWRRLLPAGFSAGPARGLGVALATFGLAGILLGNLSLNLGMGGSAASAPAAAPGAAHENSASGAGYDTAGAQPPPGASPIFGAASAAASAVALPPEPSAAASTGVPAAATAAPSAVRTETGGQVAPAASGGPKSAGPMTALASGVGSLAPLPASTGNDLLAGSTGTSGSFPLIPVSVVALLVGVVLILASFRSPRTPG